MSSGNEKPPRDRNSNGRISIPFVQEQEKPLAIVKETIKDSRQIEAQHLGESHMEIAKNLVDELPIQGIANSVHNIAILEIED